VTVFELNSLLIYLTIVTIMTATYSYVSIRFNDFHQQFHMYIDWRINILTKQHFNGIRVSEPDENW